jgi:hypothetical protein
MATTTRDPLLTVDGLLRAFTPVGLVDGRTSARPPRQALTVLHRALKRLALPVLAVLVEHHLGPWSPLSRPQQGALGRLLVAISTEPTLASATSWLAVLDEHADQLGGEALRHELIEAVLEWRFRNADVELTGDARTTRLDELVELWMVSVHEGYSRPSSLACTRALGLVKSHAHRGDVGRAADIALTAARWASRDDVGLCRACVTSQRAEAVAFLSDAGRHDEVLALSDEWDLADECEEHLGTDSHDTFHVHVALAAAHRERKRYDIAVEHARAAVWAVECALGADDECTLLALAQLGGTLLDAGRVQEALDVARHGKELADAASDRRPEGAAHAAVGVAICLHATGAHDEAFAVARAALATAERRLGPYHRDTISLRELAGDP